MSGWGKNDFVTGSYQTIQKQVDVPILAPSVCQSALSATILGSSFVFDTNSFLCAGGEVGKDSCTVSRYSYFFCFSRYGEFTHKFAKRTTKFGTTN